MEEQWSQNTMRQAEEEQVCALPSHHNILFGEEASNIGHLLSRMVQALVSEEVGELACGRRVFCIVVHPSSGKKKIMNCIFFQRQKDGEGVAVENMELDADKLWLSIQPYVKAHISELLQLTVVDALNICRRNEQTGSLTTKLEMQALCVGLSILMEALKS